jgi:hypothetical protein
MRECEICHQQKDEPLDHLQIDGSDTTFASCCACQREMKKLLKPKYLKDFQFLFIEEESGRLILFDRLADLEKWAKQWAKLFVQCGCQTNRVTYSEADQAAFIGEDVQTVSNNELLALVHNSKSTIVEIAWRHFGTQQFLIDDSLLTRVDAFEIRHNIEDVERFAVVLSNIWYENSQKKTHLARFSFPVNDSGLHWFRSVTALTRFLSPLEDDFVRNQVWIPLPGFHDKFTGYVATHAEPEDLRETIQPKDRREPEII